MDPGIVLVVGLVSIFGAVVVAIVGLIRPPAAKTGVARSLAVIGQMTTRQEYVAPEAQGFAQRVLLPGLARVAGVARRLSGADSAERLQRKLELAGNPSGWTPERVLGAKGAGLILGALFGLYLGGSRSLLLAVPATVALGALGFFLPDLLVYNAGIKRQEKLQKSLAEGLDLLTVSVEAGLGFDAALGQVARNTDGPFAAELFRVLQEMQIGKSRNEAFTGLADRTSVDELRTFVSALVQADRLGVPIAAVLREQSREMRLKRRQRAEEKAQKVPVKILFPLMAFVLPTLFIAILGPGVIQMAEVFSRTL